MLQPKNPAESETTISSMTPPSENSGTAGAAELLLEDDAAAADYRLSSEELADEIGLPMNIAQPALVGYRSVGIGAFGAIMRWGGMVRTTY